MPRAAMCTWRTSMTALSLSTQSAQAACSLSPGRWRLGADPTRSTRVSDWRTGFRRDSVRLRQDLPWDSLAVIRRASVASQRQPRAHYRSHDGGSPTLPLDWEETPPWSRSLRKAESNHPTQLQNLCRRIRVPRSNKSASTLPSPPRRVRSAYPRESAALPLGMRDFVPSRTKNNVLSSRLKSPNAKDKARHQ